MKLVIASLTVLVLLGCASEGETTHNPGEVYGARFKDGKGVELSPVMKDSLGVKVAPVTEQLAKDGAQVAVVPAAALLQTVQGKFVYVVNGDHYLRTEVKPGTSEGAWIEIAEGLYPGDEVVERPVDLLWYAELQALRGGTACTDDH